MKIGIITFHRAQNHGAVLQCYALQETLKRLGHDVEIVDYRSRILEREYQLIETTNFRSIVSSFLHLYSRIINKLHFIRFRKKYLNISKKIYKKQSDFVGEYDYVVVGSDQIWNPVITGGFDPVYFGDVNTKFGAISYAASMGDYVPETEEEESQLSAYLKKLKSISVREDKLKETLSQYSDKNIQLVLDPTLLLRSSDYAVMLSNLKYEDYVFYYQLKSNSQTMKSVIKASEARLKHLIVFMGKDYERGKYDYWGQHKLSIDSFLGCISNADYVYTSSFHGLAFSIIFRKNFSFVCNENIGRGLSLLNLLGLNDRTLTPGEESVLSETDYSNAESRLSNEISKAETFLKESL